MEETSTTAIQVATWPFDIADGDIILRSSDRIDFHLHKYLLTTASPILSELLFLPSTQKPGTDEEKDGVPIVCMTEDSRALDLMLRICHPATVNPSLDDLEDIKKVLHVSRKFELACARDIAVQRLGKAAEEHPQRVFAIAWAIELKDVVQAAARSTLRDIQPLTYYEEFANVTTAAVFKFQEYQRRCVDAAKFVASSPWMPPGQLAPLIRREQGRKRCSRCAYPRLDRGSAMHLPEWFVIYNEVVCSVLEREPRGAAIFDSKLVPPVAASVDAALKCVSCAENVVEIIDVLQKYGQLLAEEVDRRVSEIVVESPF